MLKMIHTPILVLEVEISMPLKAKRRARVIGERLLPEISTADLPIQVRHYIVAIRWFIKEIAAFRVLFEDGETFLPVREYLDSIESSLMEAIDWLEDYVDQCRDVDLGDLRFLLKEDTASALDDALGCLPTLFKSIPSRASNLLEGIMSDFESLNELLLEDIRAKGYQVYHVLIDADFPQEESQLTLAAHEHKLSCLGRKRHS